MASFIFITSRQSAPSCWHLLSSLAKLPGSRSSCGITLNHSYVALKHTGWMAYLRVLKATIIVQPGCGVLMSLGSTYTKVEGISYRCDHQEAGTPETNIHIKCWSEEGIQILKQQRGDLSQ